MSKFSFLVTQGTLGQLEDVVSTYLTKKPVYFDGHCLYQSSEMALGSAHVHISPLEMIGTLAVCLPFTFEVEHHRHQRNLVIPIIQPEMPEFSGSMVCVDEGNLLLLVTHVTNSRQVEQRFELGPEKPIYGFMAVRFILNEDLITQII